MTCVSDSCNQGRAKCPTPDTCAAKKPPYSLWRYVCGYVPLWLRYRDHKAAKYAGHLAAITQPDAIEFVGREPVSGEAKTLIVALVITWGLVAALSYSDDLVLMWPRMVAAISIG